MKATASIQESRSRLPSPLAAACALERLPHLLANVQALWGRAEFEHYVSHLIMDSRDGKRQGLPWDAAKELVFLSELSVAKRAAAAAELTGAPFRQVYAMCLANGINTAPPHATEVGLPDHWSDPAAHKESGRMGRSQGNAKRASADDYRWELQKTWWQRLFG